VKKSLLILCAFLLNFSLSLPTVALAQSPPATPDLPYHFEPVDFDPNAAPALPLPSVYTPDFINALGSYALTVFAMFDQWNVLGIFVVIMLGLSALWWLHSFVTDRPNSTALDLSGALDTADALGTDDTREATQVARYVMREQKKFRF